MLRLAKLRRTRSLVGLAERGHRRLDPRPRLVVAVRPLGVDDGHLDVVDAVAVEAERPLAQAVVALQRRRVRPRHRDQRLDHRRRDVVHVERRVERRGVAPRLRHEPVALADAVVERRVRVARRLERPEVRAERRFPVGLLARRREDRSELAVRHGDGAAVAERDRRELRVGRGQRLVRVRRRGVEPAHERHQPLALVVEDVLLQPVEVLDGEPVDRQRGAGVHPPADALERQAQQLGVEPRRGLLPAGHAGSAPSGAARRPRCRADPRRGPATGSTRPHTPAGPARPSPGTRRAAPRARTPRTRGARRTRRSSIRGGRRPPPTPARTRRSTDRSHLNSSGISARTRVCGFTRHRPRPSGAAGPTAAGAGRAA